MSGDVMVWGFFGTLAAMLIGTFMKAWDDSKLKDEIRESLKNDNARRR